MNIICLLIKTHSNMLFSCWKMIWNSITFSMPFYPHPLSFMFFSCIFGKSYFKFFFYFLCQIFFSFFFCYFNTFCRCVYVFVCACVCVCVCMCECVCVCVHTWILSCPESCWPVNFIPRFLRDADMSPEKK